MTTISPFSSDLSASAAAAAARASANARKNETTFTLPDDTEAAQTQSDPRTSATATQNPPAATDQTAAPAKDANTQTDSGTASDTAKKDDTKKKDAATDGKPAAIVVPVGATAGAGADVAQAVAAAAAGTQPGAAAPNTSATKTTNLVVGASAATANAVTALAGPVTQPVAATAKTAAATDKAGKPTLDAASTKASLTAPATAATTSDDKPKSLPTAEALAKALDPSAQLASANQAQTSPDAAAAALAQQTSQQQAAAATTAATTATTPQTATAVPTATIQTVPIEIGMQALKNGSSTFDIRLDPADLGKVQVKLKISDGNVSASLVVDRVETLQMLQRESKTLERAFEQAGLKSNPDDLQFSLRQDNRQQGGSGGDQPQARASKTTDTDTPVLPANVAIQRIMQNRAYSSGVDIQI